MVSTVTTRTLITFCARGLDEFLRHHPTLYCDYRVGLTRREEFAHEGDGGFDPRALLEERNLASLFGIAVCATLCTKSCKTHLRRFDARSQGMRRDAHSLPVYIVARRKLALCFGLRKPSTVIGGFIKCYTKKPFTDIAVVDRCAYVPGQDKPC